MNCNITAQIQSGLEQAWQEAAVSSRLSDAETVAEYLSVLRGSQNWNTLSFCLRRYLYLHFTKRTPDDDPVPYTVSFCGKEYDFSPVSPDVEINETEINKYADLMYRMTLDNHCFYRNKRGVADPKKGAISKQQYINYLNGQRITCQNVFPLSFALGFSLEDMTRIMNVLGESPVYNFRSPIECIYYFCLSFPVRERWQAAEELAAFYVDLRRNAPLSQPEGAGMTAQLGREIDEIIGDESLTVLERRAAFECFLTENVSQFTYYSRTARELLAKELYSPLLLDTRKTKWPLRDKLSTLFVHPNDVTLTENLALLDVGTFEELFSELYNETHLRPLRLRDLNLEHRLTADLISSTHLARVFYKEDSPNRMRDSVTKQDFLQVRLLKFSELLDEVELTERERLELIKRFRSATDRILTSAGLPPLYAANPMDHMVLTALCQKDPAQFTQQLFAKAAQEEAL